jgi:3-mercaptopropionate dioxygenase
MNSTHTFPAHPEHASWTTFLESMRAIMATPQDEAPLLAQVDQALRLLVSKDDWLATPWSRPGADSYRQYPLYIDPQGRFSVVSFVWGPGQSTPIHDHTTWGVIGVLRGAEQCTEYAAPAQASPMMPTGSHLLEAGDTDKVSPAVGDIHLVSNAKAGETSISVHVYGGNIGNTERHVYDPSTGAVRHFVSGYSPL